ncbi:hypothetical protein HK102_003693 [Quaeritorhiza haematococci]|nr:hypothetical protein HK102_003693 [Quaeritorhiza haematococci]
MYKFASLALFLLAFSPVVQGQAPGNGAPAVPPEETRPATPAIPPAKNRPTITVTNKAPLTTTTTANKGAPKTTNNKGAPTTTANKGAPKTTTNKGAAPTTTNNKGAPKTTNKGAPTTTNNKGAPKTTTNKGAQPTPTGQPGVNLDQLRALMTDPEFNQIVSSCNGIAAEWIRASFHDAGTFDGNSGGADGSLQFELQDAENFGLDGTISFFQGTKQRFPDVSMADIIDWGAITSIRACGGPDIPFRAGRVDATSRNREGTLAGNPNTPIPELIAAFGRQGLSARDFVALSAGSHSVGGRRFNADGFDGTPDRFDNEIFKRILTGTATFASDNGLADNPTTRPIVEQFANNQQAFFTAFSQAYTKMMDLGVPANRLVVVA